MRGTGLAGWNPRRLRLVLGLFFVALAIPASLLIHQAFGHLKWAAFRQHQLLAEELAARIDTRLREIVNAEEARAVADYGFLVATWDGAGTLPQRSPLARYPVSPTLPGLVGHFQVDAAGTLTTPLVPTRDGDARALGIAPGERAGREALEERIRGILTDNRLVQGARIEADAMPEHPMPEDPMLGGRRDKDSLGPTANALPIATPKEERALPQAAFDRLSEIDVSPMRERKTQAHGTLGRVEDLKLDERFQQAAPAAPATTEGLPPSERQDDDRPEQGLARTEGRVPGPAGSPAPNPLGVSEPRADGTVPAVSLFETEVDPFRMSLLDSGHFVLFRQVRQDGQRLIQGVLVEQRPFLRGGIEGVFRETLLSQTTDLVVAWDGDVLAAYPSQASRGYLSSAEELRGALLLRTRLSAPLQGMELLFSVGRLPTAPGAHLLYWIAAALVAILCGGISLIYRLGLRQIALARQQQDFVSAVSHELKTPLTSIRMYGELLREGWVPEEKRPTYYAFIHEESERLSRLIENVLQLARMTRNDLRLHLRPVTAGELTELIRSKVTSRVERAGFTLNIDCGAQAAAAVVLVDEDAFSQILINLVDNAVKFSADAERKQVDIGCRLADRGTLVFWVRDYGPGVPPAQMRKIFRLFYRVDGGLTRETAGTGIGLALVRQLAEAMGGTVDVANREPGAELRFVVPVSTCTAKVADA
ncbi:sensor histidine kinase [Thiocapsa marina]|uniref:histidine kinase n=1 Tax=Thiocapsa marina 5811 TaxID=768671 RepID=F9U960_9GAMM|nr:HAMP domain-containing sensor histidine kinase [Thiocapsa marina]EGV19318.1 integral membrane sensor signal transduction histidine kinase [Thiocapsa marina 5811]